MTNHIQQLTGNVGDFAAAVYNNNSLDELIDARESSPDVTDCHQWLISKDDWQQAIHAALHDRLTDWVRFEFVPGCESNGVDPLGMMYVFYNAEVHIDADGDVYAAGWVSTDRLAAFYRHGA